MGTLNLLNSISKKKLRKIIFSASASCYGNPKEIPTSEKAKIQTLSPYALTKYINELYAKRRGIIQAKITSAVPISDDLENQVVKYLESIKKGQINLTKQIDKTIIAGFVLDFDDIQFDASAKKKLNKMQKQLTQNN